MLNVTHAPIWASEWIVMTIIAHQIQITDMVCIFTGTVMTSALGNPRIFGCSSIAMIFAEVQ